LRYAISVAGHFSLGDCHAPVSGRECEAANELQVEVSFGSHLSLGESVKGGGGGANELQVEVLQLGMQADCGLLNQNSNTQSLVLLLLLLV
jgi:hypothetical protein